MPEIVRKVIPVTTTDLISVMERMPRNTPVWIGICSGCLAGILAFEGPATTCKTCSGPVEVRPLTKKKATQ